MFYFVCVCFIFKNEAYYNKDIRIKKRENVKNEKDAGSNKQHISDSDSFWNSSPSVMRRYKFLGKI